MFNWKDIVASAASAAGVFVAGGGSFAQVDARSSEAALAACAFGISMLSLHTFRKLSWKQHSTSRPKPAAIGDPRFKRFIRSPTSDLFNRCYHWQASLPAGVHRKGVVFLVHGASEHLQRYRHVAECFSNAGYEVFGMDAQGHGHSEGDRMMMQRFDDYVIDYIAFVRHTFLRMRVASRTSRGDSGHTCRIGGGLPADASDEAAAAAIHEGLADRTKQRPKNVFIVGHSMGGLIAAHCAARYPDLFDGLVTSGAALQLDPKLASPLLLRIVNTLAKVLPKMPMKGIPSHFGCRDPEVVRAFLADPLVYHGPASAHWANQMLVGMADISKYARQMTVPALIMHGSDDLITAPEGSRAFVDICTSEDKRYREWPGRYHQLFNDPGYEEVLQETLEWVREHTDSVTDTQGSPESDPSTRFAAPLY